MPKRRSQIFHWWTMDAKPVIEEISPRAAIAFACQRGSCSP
jgi:hypothetical protein